MSVYTPTTEEVRDYIRAADRVTAHMFAGSADSVEAFDRWLAAHDADVRAGVVAEEPEWEYGIRDTAGDEMITGPQSTTEGLVPLFAGEVLERRRKAGPWVPVKQEGAEK
ncbi:MULTISPECIES: hypothetical protein [Microbacterium]|uniref:hypothetical protein n=1 Tax=Microbacterium TaxID=33882 RepID=UPI0026EF01C8|nr:MULTISPECIES: hypothetical protein [Microbacterium]